MLSVYPIEVQHYQQQFFAPPPYYPQPHARPMPHRQPDVSASSALGYHTMNSMQHQQPPKSSARRQQEAAVSQALEIARESPDGAQDPTVSKILEVALSEIWERIQYEPNSYVMTREEFAVFNFFQHRFTGCKEAIDARKRYWDNVRA